MGSKDYLQGMPSEIANQFDTRVVQDVPAPSSATITTKELHVYADGTTGSDSNDGLSVLTPKKTLRAVFGLIPDMIKHIVVVHLSGVFNTTESLELKFSRRGITFPSTMEVIYIDGGDTWTVVADNSGSPWTADISSTSSIGKTGLSWTVDDYAGYMVEILSGPCIGEYRTIQGNTATTITPTANFSTNPGTATFRIVKPATTISSNVSVYLRGSRSMLYWIQNLDIAGGIYQQGAGYHALSHCIYRGSNGYGLGQQAEQFRMHTTRYITTPRAVAVDTVSKVGCGVFTGPLYLYGMSILGLALMGSVFRESCLISGCCMTGSAIAYGTRFVKGLTLHSCNAITQRTTNNISTSSNHALTLFGGTSAATVGLIIYNCTLTLGQFTVSNCTSHGIEVSGSRLFLTQSVLGSGNSGAGIYAHSSSLIHTKSGAPPAITGTVGDLSTDGTTQKSTWAAIEAGTPAVDSNEFVLAKKVA